MKEETARASASLELPWPQRAVLRRALVPALFVALALLVTLGYGSGVQLNDGQADLHLDPLKFLWSLLHAWNPALYMGTHTGFWFTYETPYAWIYAAAQIFHIPQDFAQRFAVFAVYLGVLASMYYCLRSVAPWLGETARVAGSVAYLFNMYVALNSQAQIVWLLTYATLPAMIGITARAMRGEMNVWRAALGMALLVLVGGGINPPLVAINVILLGIFVLVMLALSERPALVAKRTLPFVVVASLGTFFVNLYWVVPFVDYFRSVWLNGVLSEGPSLHNAATSFDNVLRGLGHWATFVSFGGRPYFPWAEPYSQGFFSALLWFVPIVALGAVAFKRNQRPATLYFLIATIVSVPIVVGYYHDALGDAVTTPIYDAFYRYFPGFQMFRFSYKWVAGVEFGICGLYALGTYSILSWLREQVAAFAGSEHERLRWLVPAVSTALVIVPILVFIPVIVHKMNYPASVLPSWEYRENALLGNDDQHRVALFPTQFLEQFDWGNPEFYIENSLVDRPMIYGLLGSEPSEGTDAWVRRAYRATREGLPFAGDMFRVLGVNTFLQRDDFLPVIDFSSPDEWRFNSTTLTHDLLHRVLGATPQRSDGPLHTYRLSGALPLVYGVTHPVISAWPTFSEAYLGDVGAMARGQARFDAPTRSMQEFSATMRSLSPIVPLSTSAVRDLAVNASLAHGTLVRPSSANVQWAEPFKLPASSLYTIFAREQSLLFPQSAPRLLQVDGAYFRPVAAGGAWTEYGQVLLSRGKHWVSDGYEDPKLVVALVKADEVDAWTKRVAGLGAAAPQNRALEMLVYAKKARLTLPQAGRYRLRASAVGPFGPDGFIKTHVIRSTAFTGAFPGDLAGTLPYVPGDGIVQTSPTMMPESWYRDDSTAYDWQRGDSEAWMLFSQTAHLRVFVPGARSVVARAAMHVSRLQVGSLMSVTVNGRGQQEVALSGPSATAQQYDSVDHLQGPAPALASFTVTLRPGWNDVSFTFHSTTGERTDLGPDVIEAAVAPDISFTRITARGGPTAAAQDNALHGIALPKPPGNLSGDPEVVGDVTSTGSGSAWLAVALAGRNGVSYRLFALPQSGSFDIYFMHAFPNNPYDGTQRIAGIWFVGRQIRSNFAHLSYYVHGMPARALAHPQSLSSLPLLVDGRAAGNGPVTLSRGPHLITSADKEVKIALLSVTPAALPATKSFPVMWKRNSPTGLEVTAGSGSSPYLLVFGDAYHPEWTATVNGQTLPHVIVNGISNGWIVPSLPDGGKISISFTGQRFYIFAWIASLIALALLVTLAIEPKLWAIGTPER
ncbi:MAG TPA: alpha-(1-_3)-arabinofuranosyltransferase family protein [Candidatus Cybelea sp.]|nr:alpha-(1->3)-arabinofuranosyltransferase family protein [Candidatus Cybelea sp.]